MAGESEKTTAIVFDFGGVLMDWNPRYLFRKFFGDDRDAMERFLLEIGFAEWNSRLDKGLPFAEGVAELSGRFPAYRHLIEAFDRRWEETLAGPIHPTVEILARLKDSGYPLYGLSNWSVDKFAAVRRKYEFFAWFERIVLSGEVGLAKPDPGIFAVFLDRIGRRADECLFIDDSARNIAAAKGLGFRTIHYQSPAQLRGEMARMGLIAREAETGQ
ncbi:MAG: HAD family hydrolase [Bacteroidota bacterium]